MLAERAAHFSDPSADAINRVKVRLGCGTAWAGAQGGLNESRGRAWRVRGFASPASRSAQAGRGDRSLARHSIRNCG